MWTINRAAYLDTLNEVSLYSSIGKITQSLGIVFEAHLPGAAVGSLCRVTTFNQAQQPVILYAEVVGFKDKSTILMPFDQIYGVSQDSTVTLVGRNPSIRVGDALLGRVLDGYGVPIDGKGPIPWEGSDFQERKLYASPVQPLERQRVTEPLDLGVRSINGLLTCGKGQRIGIMAGSGVGKSILLGMMAKQTQADVNVIALIGERGREVREFIERDLGEEGLKKSVIVVSTSDKSPLLRMRGAFLATTIAEFFRDKSKDVLLLMDSVTRFCMAQREIGLSLGEPPASKGYTPSVFSTIPKLLERAGMSSHRGSITGIYTVLVEGDDLDDPVADSVRSILDGHIVLSRKIAQRNLFPAVDILQSTSRVMRDVVTTEHLKLANQIKDWLATYSQVEDLINIGAYTKGANSKIDQTLSVIDHIHKFLCQNVDETAKFSNVLDEMRGIVRRAEIDPKK